MIKLTRLKWERSSGKVVKRVVWIRPSYLVSVELMDWIPVVHEPAIKATRCITASGFAFWVKELPEDFVGKL